MLSLCVTIFLGFPVFSLGFIGVFPWLDGDWGRQFHLSLWYNLMLIFFIVGLFGVHKYGSRTCEVNKHF